jgi:hypothetical protein
MMGMRQARSTAKGREGSGHWRNGGCICGDACLICLVARAGTKSNSTNFHYDIRHWDRHIDLKTLEETRQSFQQVEKSVIL